MNSVHAGLAASSLPMVRLAHGVSRKGKSSLKKPVYPTEDTTPHPTLEKPLTDEELEAIVHVAEEGKVLLAGMTPKDKLQLFEETLDCMYATRKEIVEISTRYKGTYETGVAEETLAWGVSIQACRELVKTLKPMKRGKIRKPRTYGKHPSGRVLAKTFPHGFFEHALFTGFKQEVWFKPGEQPEQITAASFPDPKVWLLLASGNQASQIAQDIMQLVIRNGVVICKLNPVCDYLEDVLKKAFKPMVDRHILMFTKGGLRESQVLIYSATVDALHLTGSDKTYEAIVWGEVTQEMVDGLPDFCLKPKVVLAPGGDREALIEARKAENGPKNTDKPFTAELGCVTPFIITPGKWSKGDLDYHARNIVAGLVGNGSFNCFAAQVIVTDARWPQREAFLERLKHHMGKTTPRAAYYPGAFERRQQFLDEYRDCDIFYVETSELPSGAMPWTLVSGIDSETLTSASVAARNEVFGGVLTELPLKLDEAKGPLVSTFLPAAVQTCNEVLWGTLGCSIIIPPSAKKADPKACEQAVTDLRYGNISVNVPTVVGLSLTRATWGSYAKSGNATDIQSGNSFVYNTLMFNNPEKSVVRAPFRSPYNPVWMHDNRNAEAIANRTVKFWRSPSLSAFVALALAGVKG